MNSQTAKEKSLIVIGAIKDGLSEIDAIVLADLTWEQYVNIKKQFPLVGTIIDKAKIEYKRKIISKINSLANDGDVRAIQWIAENGALFAEDFGKKKPQPQQNPLEDALRFIQNNSGSPIKKKAVVSI
jgi:hypothetical protein